MLKSVLHSMAHPLSCNDASTIMLGLLSLAPHQHARLVLRHQQHLQQANRCSVASSTTALDVCGSNMQCCTACDSLCFTSCAACDSGHVTCCTLLFALVWTILARDGVFLRSVTNNIAFERITTRVCGMSCVRTTTCTCGICMFP